MSNMVDGSDDSKNLADSSLDHGTPDSVRQARIEAREIIDRLEPRHIDGWPSLIAVLEDCLETAERNFANSRSVRNLLK